jgi:hypothetical protein
MQRLMMERLIAWKIEVKAGSVSHARSLGQYCKLFNPKKYVLTSLDDDKKSVLPLYAFWNLLKWLNAR